MMDKVSTRSNLGIHADVALRPPVEIGTATLFPERRELHGNGAKVRLEPRVLQVLLALADANDRTVTRNELFNACWNGTVVDESALNRVITQIRRASERAGSPFTVHTVTKVGYRLEPNTASGEPEPGGRGLDRRKVLIAVGALAIATAGMSTFGSRPSRASSEAAELERRAKLALADMLPARDHEAIAMLHEAVALDPRQPTLWGTLALAHQRAAEFGPRAQAGAAAARTRTAAKQALTLDPDNSDALVALALIEPVYRNWLTAEQRYQTLAARFPNHVPLLGGQAKLLAEVGRFDEAVRLSDRIFEMEPLGPAWHWRRGMGLWAAGRPGEALQTLDKALRIWPNHPFIWATAFWVNAYSGAIDRSLALLAMPVSAAASAEERDFMRRSVTAFAARDAAQRRRTIVSNRQSAAASTSAAEQAMTVAAALGEVGESLTIARAYHFGDGFLVQDGRMGTGTNMPPERRKTLPLFWPPMAVVWETAEFRTLIRSLGLEDYWAATGSSPDYRAT